MEHDQYKQKYIVRSRLVGDVKLTFTTETINGVGYDTKVEIAGAYICFISSESIEAFAQAFSELLMTHRI